MTSNPIDSVLKSFPAAFPLLDYYSCVGPTLQMSTPPGFALLIFSCVCLIARACFIRFSDTYLDSNVIYFKFR